MIRTAHYHILWKEQFTQKWNFFFFTTSWNVPLYFVSSTHLHNLLRSLLRCIRQGNTAESGFRSCDVFPSSVPSRISLWVIPSRPRVLLRCLDSGSGSSRRPILRSPHLQHWVENHLHQRLDFIREAMKGLPHGKRRERTYTHTHTHTNARPPLSGPRLRLKEAFERS